MWLNRNLIKQQAKELIKNRVLKLFGVTFIVLLIVSVGNTMMNASYYDQTINYYDHYNDYGNFDGYEDYFNDNFGGGSSYEDDFNNFGNSGNSEYADDFNNFGSEAYGESFNGSGHVSPLSGVVKSLNGNISLESVISIISYAGLIITVLMAPLSVALTYFYVEYVSGKEFEFDTGLKSVFHNAFKVEYLKKIGVWFLVNLLAVLLSILFIIPGVIFLYSSYFAFEIMSEYPELSPWQAIKLSKKMVKGYRTELFALNVSFIPWILLCFLVFPIIYVFPYIYTTNALYYQNFKLRALAMNMITEDDFLSDAQKLNKMMNGAGQYQQTSGNNYSQPQGAPYQQGATFQQDAQQQQDSPSQQGQNNGATYGNNYSQPQGAPYQQGTPFQQGAQQQQGSPFQQGQNNGADYGNNYSQPQGAPYQQGAPFQQGAQQQQGSPFQQGQNNGAAYGNNYSQPQGNTYYQGGYTQPSSPVIKPVYFNPVMPAQREQQAAEKMNAEFNRHAENGNTAAQQYGGYTNSPNTAGENSAAYQFHTETAQEETQAPPEDKDTQAPPQVTVTKPEEPVEPEYAEPQEPTENFTEPNDPEEPKE